MRFRRTPTALVFWRKGVPIATDCMRGGELALGPAALHVFVSLTYALSVRELATRLPDLGSAEIRTAVDTLRRAGLVSTTAAEWERRREVAHSWSDWLPAAGLLHFGTRNLRAAAPYEELANVRRRLQRHGCPPAVKPPRDSGRQIRQLPPFQQTGALPEVLLNRRSWRRFGSRALKLTELSNLLGLTWGVQRWMRIAPGVRSALKTSPSGGACHPIEAYVVARRVSGLGRGVYHYRPDDHQLQRIRAGLPRDAISKYLGDQPWFADSAALFVMTAVLPRVMWKYRHPRAYRVVLIEAGHFCQTFCLLATWMGLAPFCTAAFADDLLERALGVDGVEESVIYVAGVGSRPGELRWAPWPAGMRTPDVQQPAHAARNGAAIDTRAD